MAITRRELLKGAFAGIALAAVSGSLDGCFSPKGHHTIAHEILDLEIDFGVPDPCYKLLDGIIKEAKKRIKKKPRTEEEAFNVLQTIDDILVENNFVIERNISLLTGVLSPRKLDEEVVSFFKNNDIRSIDHDSIDSLKCSDKVKIFVRDNYRRREYIADHINEGFHFSDCDGLSFVYLAVAEALDLHLAAVRTPEHVFVRLYLNNRYLNFDTINRGSYTDSFYENFFEISKQAIKKGVYLRSLDRKEVLSIEYHNIALLLFRRGHLNKAIRYLEKAAELDQSFPGVYNDLGNTWLKKGDLDKALEHFKKTVELDPHFAKAFYRMGEIYLKKGMTEDSARNFNKAFGLDPELKVYYDRSLKEKS